MQKSLKYTIFKTKWGYFGLVGTEYALYRACLPLPKRERVKSKLLKNLSPRNRESSIRNPVSTQTSLRAKRSNLTASEYESATTCKAGLGSRKAGSLAMTHERRASRIDFDRNFFRPLQEQITAYFEGVYVDFSPDVPIVLNGFSPFGSSVLCACRRIRFGQVVTYSALARKIGRPAAVRAVGGALAKNPLPLIIPCHRVIRNDGQIGGFSALGGVALKKRLLSHEQNTVRCHLHS